MGEDTRTTAVRTGSGKADATKAAAETTKTEAPAETVEAPKETASAEAKEAPAETVEEKKKAVEDNAPNSSANNSASNTTDEADGEKDEKDDKDDVTQKEASLKDRLSRKAEESRLKNKLIAKKRLSATSDHSAGSSSDTKKKATTTTTTTANGSHRATSSSTSPTSRRRSRSKSKSRDRSRSSARRSSSPYYHPHHPQRRRGGGGGGGPPPHNNPYPHGGGPWGGYPRDDPYGRRYHHHHPGGGGGGGYGPPPGGPPYHPPPPAAAYHYRGDDDDQDPFGRAPRRHYRSGSRRRSSSRSRSLSRSPDNDDDDHDSRGSSKRGRGHDDDRRRSKQARRHGRHGSSSSHRRDRRRSPSSSGSSVSSSASSTSSSGSSDSDSDHDNQDGNVNNNNGAFDKDTRTVFVNQLVLRTTSHDLRHYFRKTVGAKVQEVSLLRDKRTGKHKGCAYMELRTMADVNKALAVSGQTPDWQRFPILVKPSEAEKNYIVPVRTATTTTATTSLPSTTTTTPLPPLLGPNGLPMEAQKVYVGSLDPHVTEEHLCQIFQHFGMLQKVHLQRDPGTGLSKGFAFLKFRDPRDANLALQTMAGQVLAGRPMKTGWASHVVGSAPGVQVLTSDEFPEDASEKAQKGLVALTQWAMINGGGSAVVMGAPSSTAVAQLADAALQAALGGTGAVPSTTTTGRTATVSKIPTVAEARQIMAAGTGVAVPITTAPAPAVPPAPPDATVIGRAERPSPHLLVHNMYDKDEETEAGWAEEIRLEFMEECSQYGQLDRVVVLSQEVGGKIYASFASTTAAQKCAASLAGRWFDKRQLRVEFVDETEIPPPPTPA